MNKIPCSGNDATETNTGLLVEFDSVRMHSNLVLKATYCINKIKNGYKDVEKKSSYLRISSTSREKWNPFKISRDRA